MNENIEKYFKQKLSEINGVFYSTECEEYSYPLEGSNYFEAEHETSLWYIHRNQCIYTLMEKYIREKEIFDIGGGNGYVSKFLQDSGYNVVLMDPQKQALKNACNRGIRNLVCSTFSSKQVIDNSLPNVGLFDVLEHLKDDCHFLRELYTCMKVDSYLFITVPSLSLLWSFDDIWAGHFRRYCIVDIKKKLKESGFNIEYASYFFTFLPPAILLLKTVPYWAGRRRMANENTRKNLITKKNFLSGIINNICKFEINCLRKGRSLWYGSSCIVVAKKG